jgi:hypothetical protein
MTNPQFSQLIFTSVIGHSPSPRELAQLMATRLDHLPAAVAESTDYRVLPGVAELLPSLGQRATCWDWPPDSWSPRHTSSSPTATSTSTFTSAGMARTSDRTKLTQLGIQRAGAVLGRPVDPQQTWIVGDTHWTAPPRTAPARTMSCPHSLTNFRG